MNIDEALKRACQEPTLVKALSWIAVWETERVVGQAFRWKETGVSTASHGGGWDTCFEHCFERLLVEWATRKPTETMKCNGPFGDAFDCPVHDPRKQRGKTT